MLDNFRNIDIHWKNAHDRIPNVRTASHDEKGRKLVVQVTDDGDIVDLTGTELKLVTVDGLEVGGRNLILDSEDLTQFDTNHSSVAEVTHEDMTEEWGFSDAYRFKLSGATTSYSAVWTSRRHVSEPMNYGQLYTHSMYVKNVGTNDFYIRPNGLMGGSDITIPVGFSGKIRLTGVRRDAYDWYQIHMTPLNTGEEIELIAGRQKLEKGTKATDWTPAPEDLQFPFDLIDAQKGIYELYFPKFFVDRYTGDTKVFLELTTKDFSVTSEPFYINVFEGVR